MDKPFPAHTKAQVGMLATQQVGSDSYAGQISWVSPSQREAIFVPHGKTQGIRISLRKDGYYRPLGKTLQEGTLIYLGVAESYQDPHL